MLQAVALKEKANWTADQREVQQQRQVAQEEEVMPS